MQIFRFGLVVLAVAFLNSCGSDSERADHSAAPVEPQEPTVIDQAFLLGAQITHTAQQQIGSALRAGLARNGVASAVPYCNEVAIPITDSVADAYQVALRRTALRLRNPANAPNPTEKQHLQWYQQQLESGDTLMPKVEALANGQLLYSRPITVQGMCLNCHGTVGESVDATDYVLIKELYPKDSAVGFSLNELRGMWSVTFEISQLQAMLDSANVQPGI